MPKRKQKPIKLAVVDFEKTAGIDPIFGKAQALSDRNKDKVWVDAKQPEYTTLGRQYVLNHELCHLRLHDLGIKLTPDKEELFCDIDALVRTPDRFLQKGEVLRKRQFLKKLRWGRVADRYDIVSAICKYMELRFDRDTKESIAFYKARPITSTGALNP